MNVIFKRFVFAFLSVFMLASGVGLEARTAKNLNTGNDNEEKGDKTQARKYERFFDVQQNTVSNIEFYTSNYGIFGMDVLRGRGGGYWPRGSQNQYIFSGGIWFAARKFRTPTDSVMKKYVEVSYNPNNGQSWFVPGHIMIDEGDLADQSDIKKYRTYFSTDFRQDGSPVNPDDGPNWPIWDASGNEEDTLKKDRYFGWFISDEGKDIRDKSEYPKGPAYISGEDIYACFKDTDLNYYDGGYSRRKNEGYPLRLQYELTIYSWGFGYYKDFIFLKYDITNYSEDTLRSCWMAPVMDVDLGRRQSGALAAGNDRTRYYNSDTTLNLAFQWTESDRGEKDHGFGYLGFDFLESPAVIQDRDSLGNLIITDSTNFVRRDSSFYANSSQLGLVTFRNWNIEDDIPEDGPRYDYMSSGIRDGDLGSGDKRFMMATGPFHLRPNDTVRVVVCLMIANTSVNREADGSDDDVQGLIDLDKFAQMVYDNNFRAPAPPDAALFLGYNPLNNAVKIMWDSTSEMSNDIYEKGLDFMGYRLYRARNPNLDTFNISEIDPQGDMTSGAGPFGWKQIAQWRINPPFTKSRRPAVEDPQVAEENILYIDSLRIVGPVYDEFGKLDRFAVRIMKVGNGVVQYPDSLSGIIHRNLTGAWSYAPMIAYIDTSWFRQPWGPYYDSIAKLSNPNRPIFWEDGTNHQLLDSIMVGIVHLNSSLLYYNPLYWNSGIKTFNSPNDTLGIPDDGLVYDPNDSTKIDSIYFKNTWKKVRIDNATAYHMTIMTPRPMNQVMNDSNHVKACLDSIYSYYQRGMINKEEFPEFQTNESIINKIIIPYFSNITNGRTYLDIGDDDNNAFIETNINPAKTEKLLNNVDYYYKLLAFDEGEYFQNTGGKINSGRIGANIIKTTPKAPAAGNPSEFKLIHVDSSLIGGLYNFKCYAIDQERCNQLFAGDTLELEFQPRWYLYDFEIEGVQKSFGLYSRIITLRNTTKDMILFSGISGLESTPCRSSFRTAFTENAFSLTFKDEAIIDSISGDTITFHLPYSKEKMIRSGEFSSGNFDKPGYCYSYAFTKEAYGTMGFSFNYSIQQWGGKYRPDSTSGIVTTNEGDPVTPVNFYSDISDTNQVLTTQEIQRQYYFRDWSSMSSNVLWGGYNNGPAKFEVTFKEGGQETMELKWDNGKQGTFIVDYLEMDVKNVIEYNRPVSKNALDSVPVAYPGPIKLETLDLQLGSEVVPDVKALGLNYNDFINRYNLCAHGFINGRRDNKAFNITKQIAKPVAGPLSHDSIQFCSIGTQGRYYKSAVSANGDTLDFVHCLIGSSVHFIFDYANKGRRKKPMQEWKPIDKDDYIYGEDFEPGDKVMLKTLGGAIGYPLPGAKVRFVVSESIPRDNKYSDALMDQISIAPNPYYITHQSQRSPYDSKIYFTRLPERCTIEIYTLTGDLIRTIRHEGKSYNNSSEFIEAMDNEAIEVWDLLSSNKQRVESQTLVAIIKTPNGAETIKRFSVVVGGFRLIEED